MTMLLTRCYLALKHVCFITMCKNIPMRYIIIIKDATCRIVHLLVYGNVQGSLPNQGKGVGRISKVRGLYLMMTSLWRHCYWTSTQKSGGAGAPPAPPLPTPLVSIIRRKTLIGMNKTLSKRYKFTISAINCSHADISWSRTEAMDSGVCSIFFYVLEKFHPIFGCIN